MNRLAFVLLVSPFYLNDFASIYITDWRLWLLIDYVGVKLFPCAVVLWLILSKTMRPGDFGLTTQSVLSFCTVFLAVTLVGTVIDQNAYAWVATLPGYAPLGGMPGITSPVWNWIDLILGLLMVAIFEELVFRGYLNAVLRKFTGRPSVIVAISSVAFGLIHWSQGLHAVLVTSFIGVVFMIAYLRTRSLPPIILAHFAINFIDFADVIPKSLFHLR